ncbi:MAG: ABC transporter ATP-binding protein [Bifidobacteriaceae bacterium]|jgi:putative ABC transport system ATP-binding protein|nr:ABC transporter ATP-binding protein [Bifidobacteriaceae bacterium]
MVTTHNTKRGNLADIVIETDNLVKAYGKGESEFLALKGVTFSIEKGESVAIIGKSGSGKSTLMHLLASLDKPTKGDLYIGGVQTASLRNKELNALRNKTFGFVFQQFFMNANDSVLHNVMLPEKIGWYKHNKQREDAVKALESVGLQDKFKNKARNLSGGEKQRVCIARAIINNPDVLFADEPTGNLDSENSEMIEDLLFGLHKNLGITLIVVTHDPELAAKCSRRIVLKDGRIVNNE